MDKLEEKNSMKKALRDVNIIQDDADEMYKRLSMLCNDYKSSRSELNFSEVRKLKKTIIDIHNKMSDLKISIELELQHLEAETRYLEEQRKEQLKTYGKL